MNGNGKYDIDRAIADIDRILREMPEKSFDPPPYLRSKILANLPEGDGTHLRIRWGRWAAGLGAAAACLLAAVVLYRGVTPQPPFSTGTPPIANAPAAERPSPPAVMAPPSSPRVVPHTTIGGASIREVKICFYHPTASKVAVTGDFNGWNPEGVLLDASGVRGKWKTTLRLKPGAYSYNFIVDGNLIVPDPNASEQAPDGYGGMNSILLVKGGSSA